MAAMMNLKVKKRTVEDLFFCEKLKCVCAFRVCLERQLQRSFVHKTKRLQARFTQCGQGDCIPGMEIQLLFPLYRTQKRPVTTWGHQGSPVGQK